MNIYLAGKMRGVPFCNFPLFDEAAECWKKAGHHPISPANLDRLMGFNATPEGAFVSEGATERVIHTLFSLMACVCGAEAIALLPGWEDSVGASMELAAAQFLSLPVYDAVTMERIEPVAKPWNALRKLKTSGGEEGSWEDVWRQSAEACIARTKREQK